MMIYIDVYSLLHYSYLDRQDVSTLSTVIKMKAEMKKKCWSMAEIGEAEWDLCDKDNILTKMKIVINRSNLQMLTYSSTKSFIKRLYVRRLIGNKNDKC